MGLATGTRVGVYEVTGPVGAGGMGEVYRARDAKLGRDVAIKVLPEAFAADPERLARFEREAKTLAALNHPNIATVYGIAESDRIHGLVMELVPGEDLAALIGRGPIPIAEALPIARQIAEALEAAHEQGIIHRDLKPANVKVRPDGTVKVLDFGLAKALDRASASGADAMNSPTLTAQATAAGLVLGTAAYMAPEQARGKPVDRRADIWAFGVVLYEMLTGRRAFGAEDISLTLAGVLKDDLNWSLLPADTPPSVQRLLRRCLEKDPRRRLSAIGDARWDLEDGTPAAPTAAGAAPVAPAPATGWRGARVALVAAAAAVVAAGLTWAAAARLRLPTDGPTTRTSMLVPNKTSLLSDGTAVSISPDGRMVAFVTGDVSAFSGQLWVRRVDSLAARAIEGASAASQPFWSPDSRQIAYFTHSKLMRVPAAGGRSQEICDIQDARGGTWSGNDVIVMAPANGAGLSRVAASGGTPTPVTVLDTTRGQTAHRFPVFLPDADHFLYAALPARAGQFDIYVGALSGGTPQLLLSSESEPIYAVGFLIYGRKGALVAQPFDPATRVLSGTPQALEDAPSETGQLYLGSPAVAASASGAIAYPGAVSVNSLLGWFDLSGRDLGHVEIPQGQYTQVTVAPDGKHAVVARQTSPVASELWTVDLVRGGATQLTTAPGTNFCAAWSPDSQYLAYSGDRTGPEVIYRRAADGSGSDEVLYSDPTKAFNQPQSWSPDGKYVIYSNLNPVTKSDLWLLPTTAPRDPVPYLRGAGDEIGGHLSPDGRWMVYLSDEAGPYEAYVQAFPASHGKVRVTTGGSSGAWWSTDSKHLLIVNGNVTQLLEADVVPGAEFEVTAPRLLGRLPAGVLSVDMSSDRQRLLTLRSEGGNLNTSMTLVQNWAAAFARAH